MKCWTRPLAMLATAVALIGSSATPARAEDTVRVLFIGNSYTRFNDLPAMVERVAASVPDGPALEAERETHGGYNLRRHWRVERVRDLVANGGFQTVVLQPHSLSPLSETEDLNEYAARFHAHASAAGAQVVLFQTWARHPTSPAYARLEVPDATAMNDRLQSVYAHLGEALDAPVAPVGTAWQRALTEDPNLALHRDDGTHPAVTGSYLSALVLYSTLTGVDPRRAEWRHWRIPRRRAARIRAIAAETLGFEAGEPGADHDAPGAGDPPRLLSAPESDVPGAALPESPGETAALSEPVLGEPAVPGEPAGLGESDVACDPEAHPVRPQSVTPIDRPRGST